MVELVRHRQTKGAATDAFDLQPPRDTPTLPIAPFQCATRNVAVGGYRSGGFWALISRSGHSPSHWRLLTAAWLHW